MSPSASPHFSSFQSPRLPFPLVSCSHQDRAQGAEAPRSPQRLGELGGPHMEGVWSPQPQATADLQQKASPPGPTPKARTLHSFTVRNTQRIFVSFLRTFWGSQPAKRFISVLNSKTLSVGPLKPSGIYWLWYFHQTAPHS